MKIRHGFVSNSSSSSFMIHAGDIEETAHSMLDTIIDDFSDWDKDLKPTSFKGRKRRYEYKTWRTNLAKALKKKDVLSGKIGIAMPSCNYDTYMILKDNCLYIATCNNHSWDIESHDREDSVDHDKINDLIKESFFYDVRNGMIHSYEIFDIGETKASCPKCKQYYGNYVHDQKGNRFCGSCLEGKLEPTNDIKMERLRVTVQNPITVLKLED